MGNEYSYETPADGEESGEAADSTASTSKAKSPGNDGDEESTSEKKAEKSVHGSAIGGGGDPPEESENTDDKDKGGGGDNSTGGGARGQDTEPPAEGAVDGGIEENVAVSAEEETSDPQTDSREPVTVDARDRNERSTNGTSDEEVVRARAMAQFIQKYGSELTPEQIANITPEQIDRLTRVESAKASAPQQALLPMPPRPIVEMREYDLNPMYAHSYLHHTAAKADLRKQMSPLRLFCLPETGGKLNVATHLYHWRGGYRERNARKTDMASNEEWKEYIKKVQPALASQRSSLWMEAPFVYEMPGVVGLNMGRGESMVRMGGKYSNNAVYEVCRYKLKLGYDVIPTFLDLYADGLPSKLEAIGSDPTSNLITLMYSTVGTLNEVVEIWRHGGGFDAMERSGAAAQNAKEWRESGSKISELTLEVTRTVFRPIAFSPLL
jgi:hypothetical protein